jgi:hypothetical protein
MKPRVISRAALALASLLASLGGCTGGGLATPPPTGAGGSGGGGGGTVGTAGTGAGGTSGPLDAGDGGSNVAADAGAGGSSVAADAGAGGADGAADARAPDASDGPGNGFSTYDGVLCPRPAQLITDFTYVAGGGGTTTAVPFGNGTGFSGTEFVYPLSGIWPVTSDVTGNNWHISGNLGDYSGFGLTFDGCSRVDASAFRGISFTISGSVAQGGMVTMGVSTLNDTIASSWLNTHGGDGSLLPGRCIPSTGTNRYTQSSCWDAAAVIPVQAVPTVRTILWSDFTGGKPESGVTPSDILAVYWFFPPPVGAGTVTPTPYPVDIVIDNLAFVP